MQDYFQKGGGGGGGFGPYSPPPWCLLYRISQTADKASLEGVGCIILHPGFQNVRLDHWVHITATKELSLKAY